MMMRELYLATPAFHHWSPDTSAADYWFRRLTLYLCRLLIRLGLRSHAIQSMMRCEQLPWPFAFTYYAFMNIIFHDEATRRIT